MTKFFEHETHVLTNHKLFDAFFINKFQWEIESLDMNCTENKIYKSIKKRLISIKYWRNRFGGKFGKKSLEQPNGSTHWYRLFTHAHLIAIYLDQL